MVSAVVTNQRRDMPGAEFFRLARRLGLLNSDDPDDERAFWQAELAQVHADDWR